MSKNNYLSIKEKQDLKFCTIKLNLYNCIQVFLVGNTFMKMADVEIREAVQSDCHKIIELIQELADYEKMPDGPKLDAAGKKMCY